MHLIRTVLDLLPADPLGWAALAVALAVLGLVLRYSVRTAGRAPVASEPAVSQPEPARETESTTDVALRELARAPDLQTLQARAAQQIDAAEHALNRLLADCAGIANLPVEPTFKPERQLKPEAAAPARQSLAA